MAEKPVAGQTACDGCGRYHGCVTAHISCLNRELAIKRKRVIDMEATLSDTLHLLMQIRELVKP